MERRERRLVREEMVELPGREPAAVEQLAHGPGRQGPDDDGLKIRQPSADRPPNSPAALLEREERDRSMAVFHDADLNVRPYGSYRLHELGSEVRTVEGGLVIE